MFLGGNAVGAAVGCAFLVFRPPLAVLVWYNERAKQFNRESLYFLA